MIMATMISMNVKPAWRRSGLFFFMLAPAPL